MKNVLQTLFLIIGFLTILEFYFICGQFTGPIMMLLVGIIGLLNIMIAIRDKSLKEALLYLLSVLALTIGYLKLM